MTCYYLDVGIASDWLKQTSLAARPVRSTTQIWVVKRHQYGIFALVLQTSFGGKKVEALRIAVLSNMTSCASSSQAL